MTQTTTDTAQDGAAGPTRSRERQGRRRSAKPDAGGGARKVNYRQLRNPFQPQTVFSEDRIAAMHESALDVLEQLGIKVLLPEARALFRAGGAKVDESSQMVQIGREMVAAALRAAPRSVPPTEFRHYDSSEAQLTLSD